MQHDEIMKALKGSIEPIIAENHSSHNRHDRYVSNCFECIADLLYSEIEKYPSSHKNIYKVVDLLGFSLNNIDDPLPEDVHAKITVSTRKNYGSSIVKKNIMLNKKLTEQQRQFIIAQAIGIYICNPRVWILNSENILKQDREGLFLIYIDDKGSDLSEMELKESEYFARYLLDLFLIRKERGNSADYFKDVLVHYRTVLNRSSDSNVYAVMLVGEQNYNISDEHSFVNAVAVVLPSLHDIVTKNDISSEIHSKFGLCYVYDLATFVEKCVKGNPTCIEALHSNYQIDGFKLPSTPNLDFLKHLRVNPLLVKDDATQSAAYLKKDGQALNDVRGSIEYNPSSLYSVVHRCNQLSSPDFVFKYMDQKREEMMDIKNGKLSYSNAKKLINNTLDKISNICSMANDEYIKQGVDYDKIIEIYAKNFSTNDIERYFDK